MKKLFTLIALALSISQGALGDVVIDKLEPTEEKTPVFLENKKEDELAVLTPTPREIYFTIENSTEKVYPHYALNQNSVVVLIKPGDQVYQKNTRESQVGTIPSRELIERNREKRRMYAERAARHKDYREGIPSEMHAGFIERDGVVVFPCNAAATGKYFLINLGGKSTKARCR